MADNKGLITVLVIAVFIIGIWWFTRPEPVAQQYLVITAKNKQGVVAWQADVPINPDMTQSIVSAGISPQDLQSYDWNVEYRSIGQK